MIWEIKHSVITNANRQAVWSFHSNIGNWARFEGDAVESITLDGPFAAGTHISTKIPGQQPWISTLVEVKPPELTIIEMELSEAVVRFTWTFEELPGERTRLSQHIVLEGPGAEAYVPMMEDNFAGNIEKGMERLAKEIAG